MKRLNQMTVDEILNISDETITKLHKLAYAENGIKIMSEPTCPKKPDVPAPDMIMYECGSITSSSKDFIDALSNLLVKNKALIRNYSSKYDFSPTLHVESEYNRYGHENQVTTLEVYSKELYAQIEDELQMYKEEKKEYETLMKEYKANEEEAKKWREAVYNIISRVRNYVSQKESYLRKFEEYLEIAEGDKDIAYKFFNKAYPSIKTKYLYYIDLVAEKGESREEPNFIKSAMYDIINAGDFEYRIEELESL